MRPVAIAAADANVDRDILQSLDKARDGPDTIQFRLGIRGEFVRLGSHGLIWHRLRIVKLTGPARQLAPRLERASGLGDATVIRVVGDGNDRNQTAGGWA